MDESVQKELFKPDPAQQQVKYPEHAKLMPIVDKSQCVHNFLEWLEEQDIVLAKRHEHTDGCYDGKHIACGCHTDELYDHMEPCDKLLARFFEIDLRKIDDEKREMLEECRKMNEQRQEGK